MTSSDRRKSVLEQRSAFRNADIVRDTSKGRKTIDKDLSFWHIETVVCDIFKVIKGNSTSILQLLPRHELLSQKKRDLFVIRIWIENNKKPLYFHQCVIKQFLFPLRSFCSNFLGFSTGSRLLCDLKFTVLFNKILFLEFLSCFPWYGRSSV